MDVSSTPLAVTIHHHGKPHTFELPPDATLQDLSSTIADTLNIPSENQKLLITPKPGMQKHPFPATPLSTLPLTPKTKITLLGTPAKEVESLHAQAAEAKRRLDARASAAAKHKPARRTTPGIHTLSGSGSANTYTFHRLEPLPHLPNPSRSLAFLARLRDDPGIRAAMANHRFSVPLLTEMDPAEHTTRESRTLGLNRNKGEVIELRLRTDAYDGYRDYRTIRRTLCHELAHCVFSEHDRDFWDLTAQIEKEVERADWKHGGRRVGEEEFYNPGDWESEKDREVVDERGWTGGEFVLGGLSSSGGGGGGGGGQSRREIMARAAEERLRREREGREER
ncbi:putative zinc metalloproteinase [Aspergillus clavatus NRRL 1]|uniref:Zinc metalloproteinase, putative n=1 Tax=Aspergillus clavatus (strain ATCC 1007 / CBS 513.65 / DSM 816 / NCTC 3887 / NRRL 1 / QM 1276 / 107) TaxID=344612 RepID=A1CPJ7_ASPCL|nr:zinc metalloproteinase, putative [Aspergillus clavatus NRRL 1]EAW07568.1 zinc metalloproteinase, putative [Aspergillus clavatus NRRL 1]